MNLADFRKSIRSLMTEVCDGPPDPRSTWIASNEAGSGILGTIAKLSPELASRKIAGHPHSIAEHVAHLRCSLDQVIRRANDQVETVDWEASWKTGPLDAAGWTRLRASLRDLLNQVVALERPDSVFDDQQMVCGHVATVAHTAYHLGAIRTLASMLR